MGVFLDLVNALQADVATVHGEPRPLAWRMDPAEVPERRWMACVEHEPERAYGASGEDPLRRLAELYAARALLVRERG